MEWLYTIFIEHSALQAVIIVSLISAIGLILGKINIYGFSLGVTFVFFIGIIAGHFGITIDYQILNYIETFGLVLFVYTLGLQVGPGFFSSFRKEGITLNMLAVGVVFIGTLLAVLFHKTTEVSLPQMIGILCGATTNTPALGAAQQTLKELGSDSTSPALTCAVAYPLGVIGVILALLFIRKTFVKKEEQILHKKEEINTTYVAVFRVCNPFIFNKTIEEIAGMRHFRFIISYIWREGKVMIPTSETLLKENDKLLISTAEKNLQELCCLFGRQEETTWTYKDLEKTRLIPS